MKKFLKSPYTRMLLVLILTGGVLYLILQKRETTYIATAPESSPDDYTSDVTMSAPIDGTREVTFGPAELLLDTGTEIRLTSSGATFDSEVVLLKGKITATVRPLRRGENFKIRTFNVTAGIRGTKFTVAIIGGVFTIVHVIEGSVWVEAASGTPVTLTPGQTANIHGMWEPEVIGTADKDRSVENLSSILNNPLIRDTTSTSLTTTSPLVSTSGEILSGVGTWSNTMGFKGSISLSIDVAKGTYTGQYRGENKAGANTDRVVTLEGGCGGTYTGDKNAGKLSGWIEFIGTDPTTGTRTPGMRGTASGSLSGKTITGSFQGAQGNGDFNLTLR